MKDSLMLTILAGVSVFVIGQLVVKLILDPIVVLKTIFGEVSALFLREQAKIISANASEETKQELKRLSSSILAHQQAIPFYSFFAVILRMPNEESLSISCQSLNWIANHVVASGESPLNNIQSEIIKEMKTINEKLKIRVKYG